MTPAALIKTNGPLAQAIGQTGGVDTALGRGRSRRADLSASAAKRGQVRAV